MPDIQYRSDSPAEATERKPGCIYQHPHPDHECRNQDDMRGNEYDQRLAQIRAARATAPSLCGQPTKQWDQYNRAPCTLYAGHKGYHSISTFNCDECGQQRRNPPAATSTSYPYDEVVAVQCFICKAKSRSTKWGWHP